MLKRLLILLLLPFFMCSCAKNNIETVNFSSWGSITETRILNELIKKCIKYLEGKNLKKKYMITPCDHVYHTVCLEKWMKQKNECPYCKTAIPPIDG